jgi:sterol desaturase/sphingolipid hydroxylase (fatty acid hydroxylase superfamily)
MTALLDQMVVHASLIQSLLFGFVIVACWATEQSFLGGDPTRKSRRAQINALFALCVLPIQIGMTMICAGVAYWVTQNHWGLLHLVPGHDNPWIKYGLMFIVMDFLDYVYHYAMHHVPFFWRFHLVHHTDQAIDASTTVREHPGETIVRNGFLIMWVFLFGASMEVLVLRQTTESVSNILAHTTFRLRPRMARLLGSLLITPNLHHVHHHNELPYTNSNYGDVLSVWDRMFGTHATLAAVDTVFGLDVRPRTGDHGFIEALAMPFDRWSKATEQAVLMPVAEAV